MYTFCFDVKKFLRKESESEKGWKEKNAESDTSNQGKRNEIEHECWGKMTRDRSAKNRASNGCVC